MEKKLLLLLTLLISINCVGQTFTDLISTTGLPQQNAKVYNAFDYNNDTYADVIINANSQDGLYENNGDGTFTDVTSLRNYPASNGLLIFVETNINNDLYLDLRYVNTTTDSVEFAIYDGSQLEVIKKYDLSEKDHRGVIFTTTKDDCDTSYASIIEAIEAYFTPEVRTDLMTVCVAGDEQPYYDRALGIREVIDIYLANTE